MDESLFDPKSPLAMMASQVVLEITERASLSSVGDLRDRITRLRNIGYRIAVDDLGAGYAGLSAFVALSPDFVKLDMSLVRDVHRSTTQQRLIHSLLAVCKDLDIRVVSEGVETPEELATLRDLGCELFQGFLFARPGLGLTLEPNWG
jgi:EAL domain-containing protein (putative c-di-GMP-specific phosphodiesterase class I)